MEEVRRRTGPWGLELVMINVWEHLNARAEALQFCQLYGIDGHVLLDEEGSYVQRLGVRGVPCNVLVGEDGVVRDVGITSPGDLWAALCRLGLDLAPLA